MNVKEYKFCDFSTKDMFQLKLAEDIPDFGYITSEKRKAFFEFLLEMGFLKIVPAKRVAYKNHNLGVLGVCYPFYYTTMSDHKPMAYRMVPTMVLEMSGSYRVTHITSGMGIDA